MAFSQVRASISAQMGGIGSVILTRTEKRKMFTVGVWIRMSQCRKARSGSLHYERKKNRLKRIYLPETGKGLAQVYSGRYSFQ